PPVVARCNEEAARAPFEALLEAVFLGPEGGDAVAGEDVNLVVVAELDGVEALAGRNLADPGLADALHAFQLDEAHLGVVLFPEAELKGAEVFDVVAAVDGDA